MPSKSKAQHNLMAMVAHDPKAAKRLGIPQSVGRDYVTADKGKKFRSGGAMKERKAAARIFEKAGEKALAKHERREDKGKEKDTPAIAKKEEAVLRKVGAPKAVREYERKEHAEMGMKKGGMAGSYRRAADGITQRGKTRGAEIKMASGGSVGSASRRADGIAMKGKTRGKMC